jgi:hypothetical protein
MLLFVYALLAKKKIFIISKKTGQLGNRLQVFARIIGFAQQNNFLVLNPAFAEYAGLFKSTSMNLLSCYPEGKLPVKLPRIIREALYESFFRVADFVKSYSLNTKIKTLKIAQEARKDGAGIFTRRVCNLDNTSFIKVINENKIVFIHDFYILGSNGQNNYADKIRRYFSPDKNVIKTVKLLLDPKKGLFDIFVGVHIRLGDYREYEKGRWYYSLDQYSLIMQRVKDLFYGKKILFVIISNENISGHSFSKFDYIFGTGVPIEDLYLLSRCDYLVGPPSSYSRWAAFYGNIPLCVVINANQEIAFNNLEWDTMPWPSRDITESIVSEWKAG